MNARKYRKKYLKKPNIFEAMQWDGTELGAEIVESWVNSGWASGHQCVTYLAPYEQQNSNSPTLEIEKVEEQLDPGDYIVKEGSNKMRRYDPCQFDMIYEEITE